MQIVPVQPHSKTTEIDSDQAYTIVIMGEENSQAMVENDEELKEARESLDQGCHGTGKTGNLKVHFSRQGKHRKFAKKY